MQFLFVSLYHFFNRRKPLFLIVFISTFLLWIALAFKVELREDITSMLPDSKAIKAMNDVISHTQAGEQVILLMSFKDSTRTDPDSLINAANNFTTQLESKCGQWIDTISLQVG